MSRFKIYCTIQKFYTCFLIIKFDNMAKSDFINQLKELGFEPQGIETNNIFIQYVAPVGKNIGKKVFLGFIVDDSFPMNCPTGPHFKAIDSGWIEPSNNIHESPFGRDGWRYWSRPFPQWNSSDKTVKAYLGHIKNLLMIV